MSAVIFSAIALPLQPEQTELPSQFVPAVFAKEDKTSLPANTLPAHCALCRYSSTGARCFAQHRALCGLKAAAATRPPETFCFGKSAAWGSSWERSVLTAPPPSYGSKGDAWLLELSALTPFTNW